MCNVLDHNMSDYLHLGASTSPMQLKLSYCIFLMTQFFFSEDVCTLYTLEASVIKQNHLHVFCSISTCGH